MRFVRCLFSKRKHSSETVQEPSDNDVREVMAGAKTEKAAVTSESCART